jgi:hypothetical protein
MASSHAGGRRPGDRSAHSAGCRNHRGGAKADAMPDRGVSRPRAWGRRCDRGLEDRDERRRPDKARPLASKDLDVGEAAELRVLRGTRSGCISRSRWKGVPSQRDGRLPGIGATRRRSPCGCPLVSSRALNERNAACASVQECPPGSVCRDQDWIRHVCLPAGAALERTCVF